MDKKVIALVKDLTTIIGPSGYERKVREYVISKVKPFCDSYSVDNIGNVLFEFKSKKKNAEKVIFASHMDEVGFMIFNITEEGFLYLMPIGGWNTLTLPSTEIDIVNTDNEIVVGVIGQLSPHFLKKGDQGIEPTFDTLFVDIGAKSKKEVEEVYKIKRGCIATPHTIFKFDYNSNRAVAKSFDDRIGCVAQILLAQIIDKSKLEYDVTLAFTVQEEVGHRGATVIQHSNTYDYAIIIEGAPADDLPSYLDKAQTKVGQGCHIRIFDPTHIGNPLLLKYLDDLANKNKIRVQYAIRKGGGTDAASIALSKNRVRSVIIGVPTRYAHSHTSVISLDDLLEVVKLGKVFCYNKLDKNEINYQY